MTQLYEPKVKVKGKNTDGCRFPSCDLTGLGSLGRSIPRTETDPRPGREGQGSTSIEGESCPLAIEIQRKRS